MLCKHAMECVTSDEMTLHKFMVKLLFGIEIGNFVDFLIIVFRNSVFEYVINRL